MIEIYLNPYGTVLGGDALEATTSETSLANGSLVDSKEDTPKAVEALLRVTLDVEFPCISIGRDFWLLQFTY